MRAPSKAEWIAAGSWMKDRAAAFTATTFMFLALWGIVAVCVVNLYYFDMEFYGRQAPPSMSEWSFKAIGFVFRSAAVFLLPAVVWAKVNKASRRTQFALRFMWAITLIPCFAAALGAVTEGNDYREREAAAITRTAEVSDASVAEQIDALEKQKGGIRSDTAAVVASLQTAIDNITKDGIDNDSEADPYRADITAAQTAARDQIGAIDRLIVEKLSTKQTAQNAATEQAVSTTGHAAIWNFAEHYTGIKANNWRDGIAVYWIWALEIIGAIGAGTVYALQVHMAARARLQAAGALGGKTTARRNRVRGKLKAIEDLRAEKAGTASDLTEELDPIEDDDLSEDDEDDEPEAPRQAAE